MQSLFPQSRPGADTQAPVVQFRAGKCAMSSVQANGKYTVTPEARPGRISLVKGNDGLMHFKWTNGVTNSVEDDRIVFPGEYVFKKVKTGREDTNERVYMLKYQSGTQRMMYWLQDKSTEKDEETVKKVNDFLTNPNAVTVAPAAGAGAGAPGGVVSPDEWMRLIGLNPAGGAGAPTAQPLAPAAAPTAQPLAPAAAQAAEPSPFGSLDLSQILRSLAVPVPPPASSAAASATAAATASTAAASAAGAASTTTAAPDGSANSATNSTGADANNTNNNNTNSQDDNQDGDNSGEGPMEQ